MMNTRNDYLIIITVYCLAILYAIFFKEIFGTVLFILSLMIYHVISYKRNNDKLHKEKEDSLSKLLSKLDRTKKENEEAYKRFISLTTTLGSGVIMVDEEGVINFANKDIKQYFDIDDNHLEYNSLSRIKPLYKFINKAYLLEVSSREQIQYLNHFYDLVSTPFFEDRLYKGCLIVVHDITTLKTAENFQKQFTADVSHELKTPLSTIKGFSEILSRDMDMNKDERIEFISILNKESKRMETIISDLLVISKMDRLDYELILEKVNIADIILESTNSLSFQIKDKNLKLKTDIEDCELLLDKNKIGQAILNLVKNAVNYTDLGEITVVSKIENKNYVIKITDTGIGISQQEYEKIFKRFYRVDSARSRDTGGSGLGLSICKNVILKHDGTISVDSVENKGTTFEIKLPIRK